MKKDRVVFISLFFIMIFFIFGVFVFSPSSEYSSLEKRKLAQFPEVSVENILSGEFMKDFENYINDQVWNRDIFVKISSYFKRGIGQKELNGVVLGKDGYLFNKFSVNETELKQVEDNIKFINMFSENYPNSIFMLIPTSQSILTDKLPKNFSVFNERLFINDIYSKVNLRNEDVFDRLLEHKEEYIYYKTDHHWTLEGAYYGYESICNSLNVEPIDKSLYDFEVIDSKFKGTIYSNINMFGENENLYRLIPKFEHKYKMIINEDYNNEYEDIYMMEELDGVDKYSVYLGGNQSIVRVISENAKYDKKVLLIKDSFSHIMMPYMVDTFSEVVMLDLRSYTNYIGTFLKSENFDNIVIIMNTDTFKAENRVVFLSK